MLTRDLSPPLLPLPTASMGALYSMRWSFICCECAGEDLRRLHCTREPSGEEIKISRLQQIQWQHPAATLESPPRGQRVKTRTKWAGFNPREGFRLKNTVCVCLQTCTWSVYCGALQWQRPAPSGPSSPPPPAVPCVGHIPWESPGAEQLSAPALPPTAGPPPPPPPFLSLPLPLSDNTCNNTVTFLHLLPTPPSSAWTPITPTAPPNIYSGKQVETLDECGCCQNARSISQIILTNTAAFYVKSEKKKESNALFSDGNNIKAAQLDRRHFAKRQWTALH